MAIDLPELLKQIDVLKLLGALAAPGGLWFWIDKYKNRIRVRVRNLGFIRKDLSGRSLAFQIENLGSSPTSLEPTFRMKGYTPKREPFDLMFRIQGETRKLSPYEAVSVQGFHSGPESTTLAFCLYSTLVVPLTRGRNVVIRVRNAEFEPIGWFRFHWEKLRFKWFGWHPS